MTAPSTSFSGLRPDLAATLMEFDADANARGLIGMSLAPVVEVAVPTGEFGKITLEEMLKNPPDTRRGADGSYAQTNGRGGKATFACVEHGIEERVDRREAAMFGGWWDAEALAAKRTRTQVLQGHESRVITEALTDRSQNTAATAVWSTGGSAKPISDVNKAKAAIFNRCGVIANTLVIPYEAYLLGREADQVVGRIFTGSESDPNAISVDMLRQVLDIERILVAGAIKNTANEGQAASVSSLWDRTKALVCRTEVEPDPSLPQFMRTFHYADDGSQIGATVESYYSDERRGDVVRSRMDTDEVVLVPECSQIITGVLA
jgi:hypothetical protein